MSNATTSTDDTYDASRPAGSSDADMDLLRTWAAEQAAAAPPVSSETATMIAHILQPENSYGYAA